MIIEQCEKIAYTYQSMAIQGGQLLKQMKTTRGVMDESV